VADSPAISIRGVSKKYRLYGSAKERLKEALHPFNKQYHREFWALRDISFDVPKGQTLGIIGRNGSGKSTLLEIICSILRPTSGAVEAEGRISALLELGAGFNPQFTGRENVIFNAELMGLSAQEIRGRLPEIEAFADIGEFIDQPVKTYSSGMFVRLAFAAAINVDPDILIVDEALSVGDAKFQHKCYAKFQDFQQAGKTILFVTHSTDAVVKHCDRAILLDGGTIVEDGLPDNVVNTYHELMFAGKLIDYSVTPSLVERGYGGFDIIHFKKNFYAVDSSVDMQDPSTLSAEQLGRYQQEGTCVVAASHQAVKQLIDDSQPDGPADSQVVESELLPELAAFLKERAEADQCHKRHSYNRNEHRYGDRRAEIVDYLVVGDNGCDPTEVESGESIDIYLKILSHAAIGSPVCGFTVKTVDGVVIYRDNTDLCMTSFGPLRESQVVVWRLSLRLDVAAGDYFISLGCGENCENKRRPLDRRYGLIHMTVTHGVRFEGLINDRVKMTLITPDLGT